MRSISLAAIMLTAAALHAQTAPSTISADPPADPANPASLVEITVPSQGAQLLGAFYLASGTQSHPTAIIYHGFGGETQSIDAHRAQRSSTGSHSCVNGCSR
jgi:hypothetical protein